MPLKNFRDTVYSIFANNNNLYYLFFSSIFFYITITTYINTPTVVPPDGYAYLWLKKAFFIFELPEIGINTFFFTGRSFTQRFVFHLLENNFLLIYLFQSFLNLIVIIYLFHIFKGKNIFQKFLLLLFLTSISFSDFFRFSPNLIGPEPIYFNLFILFLLTVFYYDGSKRNLLLISIGIFFIFSKQVAPFIVILSVILFLLLNYRETISSKEKNVLLSLCIISLSSIFISQRYDSSVKINAINNFFSRILISEERTNFCINNFQLPSGQYLKDCAVGGSVNSTCLGTQIYQINKTSRNYDINEEMHPFLKWINSYKSYPYIIYYLYNWRSTIAELNEEFDFIFRKGPLRFFSEYIFQLSQMKVTLYYPTYGNYAISFFGVLGVGINYLFLNRLSVAIFLNLLIFFSVKKYRKYSLILLIIIFSFVLSYLGDGIEYLRHTYVSTILYIIFTYLFFLRIILDFVDKLINYLKKKV